MRQPSLYVRIAALLGAALLLTPASPSAADDGMRCDGELVSRGDSTYEVRQTCGEPDAADRYVEERRVVREVLAPCPSNPRALCRQRVVDTVQVVVDRWTYDFGRNRFIRFATFENGNLAYVDTGDYGRK